MKEYDFSHISEARDAVDALYLDADGNEKKPTDEERNILRDAIKRFYKTRTICDLFEIYDWTDDKDRTSIFEYEPWLLDPFEAEIKTRSIWLPDDVTKVLNAVLATWSGNDSLIRRVEGIQKKMDRIAKLLENVQVTTSAKTILDL